MTYYKVYMKYSLLNYNLKLEIPCHH
jgi:hypothetical protein